MSATRALAEFAIDPALATPPPDAAHAAARCLLDSIGCALGGADTRMGRLVREFGAEQGGHPIATIIGGDGLCLPPMLAALVNGQQANVLDFDDTYLDLGHTGAAVIPAALAVGQQVNATGSELRAAIIAGYEVANRVGLTARPSNDRYRVLYPVGWHSFGATAAAGRLLGFDATAMQNALGITLEHMQVATTITLDTVHAFKAGKLGQSGAIGILAASLAAKGFEGKRTALDEGAAFWLAMGSDRSNPASLTTGLGERWTIAEMSFKPFPSCRMTHPALGAAATLIEEYDVAPDQIKRIDVRTFSRMLQLTDPTPATPEAIPFSLPLNMGFLFRRLPAGPNWASPEAPHDKEALALAARVNVIADPEFDRLVDTTGALPAETTIELDGGRQLRHTLLDAPWGAGDPPSDDALTRKFLGMAEPILNGGASKLASAIMTLSGSEPASARDIMSLLH
jgi:2-methylcitrate dehydratase PrpD